MNEAKLLCGFHVSNSSVIPSHFGFNQFIFKRVFTGDHCTVVDYCVSYILVTVSKISHVSVFNHR